MWLSCQTIGFNASSVTLLRMWLWLNFLIYISLTVLGILAWPNWALCSGSPKAVIKVSPSCLLIGRLYWKTEPKLIQYKLAVLFWTWFFHSKLSFLCWIILPVGRGQMGEEEHICFKVGRQWPRCRMNLTGQESWLSSWDEWTIRFRDWSERGGTWGTWAMRPWGHEALRGRQGYVGGAERKLGMQGSIRYGCAEVTLLSAASSQCRGGDDLQCCHRCCLSHSPYGWSCLSPSLHYQFKWVFCIYGEGGVYYAPRELQE